ncbi:MAG: 6,7-dimethyl-8-ribityllumazine synthase [Bradymonadales bacterium]|nr:6,7-dimethyl-8-ribityllumazine synthase [Bradymonadales bacterium]
MPRVIEGNLLGTGKRFAIIAGRFNHFITDRLVEGALDTLVRHGVQDQDITLIRVPGSFEVPMAADRAARSGRYQAIICLSTLIRGDTPHFEYIAAETTKGIANSSLSTGVPIAFGVLTTDTIEQAIERAGTKAGNKGAQAASAALEMANLYEQLNQP